MRQAEIDINAFKAYLTRSAAGSPSQVQGISVADIMKIVDWTREFAFRQFLLQSDIGFRN